MALATQCPHCKTIFRVAQDQLKLRGGIVRCGACHEIFDGNASLVDLNAATAAPTEAPADAPVVAPSITDNSPAVPHEPVADAGDEVPVYALDLGAALDPLGILPKPEGEDEDQHDAGEPVQIDDDGDAEPAVMAAGDEAPEHTPAEPDAGVAADEQAADDLTALPAHDLAAQQEPEPAEEPEHELAGEPVHDFAEEPAEEHVHERREEHASASLATEPQADITSHDDRVEPRLDHADEELVAAVPAGEDDLDFGSAATGSGLPHSAFEHTPLPQRESADGMGAASPLPPPKSARARQLARRSKLTPTKIDAPKLRVPEIDEPEFVKRGRQRELSGKRRLILLSAGSIVLLLALATQAAVTFRNDLAARMPGTRPALAAMCSLLHCRVELPARIDNLTIETGELQTLGPDTYVLATLLHNQGSAMQAWPDIELALTDATDKPLVRRVFAPADYLPKGAAGAGFAAHGEQAVKLYFQLDQLKPSGYHIAVFYR
jgi:predicted Zn finger-like uncharacterized protein